MKRIRRAWPCMSVRPGVRWLVVIVGRRSWCLRRSLRLSRLSVEGPRVLGYTRRGRSAYQPRVLGPFVLSCSSTSGPTRPNTSSEPPPSKGSTYSKPKARNNFRLGSLREWMRAMTSTPGRVAWISSSTSPSKAAPRPSQRAKCDTAMLAMSTAPSSVGRVLHNPAITPSSSRTYSCEPSRIGGRNSLNADWVTNSHGRGCGTPKLCFAGCVQTNSIKAARSSWTAMRTLLGVGTPRGATCSELLHDGRACVRTSLARLVEIGKPLALTRGQAVATALGRGRLRTHGGEKVHGFSVLVYYEFVTSGGMFAYFSRALMLPFLTLDGASVAGALRGHHCQPPMLGTSPSSGLSACAGNSWTCPQFWQVSR